MPILTFAENIALRNQYYGKKELRDSDLNSVSRLPLGMFFYLSSDYQYSIWIPDKRDSIDDPILNYDTEGFHQIRLMSIFGLRNEDMFTFTYEGPFSKSFRQKEMFRANVAEEQGLEKYTGSLILYPLICYLLYENDTQLAKFISWLFTFKVRYSKELYFGNIKSDMDFYYVPLNLEYNQDNFENLDIPFVQRGAAYSFKSQFENLEASFGFGVFSDEQGRNHEVRIGYFSSKWNRPSDYYRQYTVEDIPIIFGTEYKAKGFWAGIEQVNSVKEFISYDGKFILGAFDQKVKNTHISLNDFIKEKENESLYYISMVISVWINEYFKSSNYGNLAMTAGGSYDGRLWMKGFFKKEEKNKNDNLDFDQIIKLFIGLSYRF